MRSSHTHNAVLCWHYGMCFHTTCLLYHILNHLWTNGTNPQVYQNRYQYIRVAGQAWNEMERSTHRHKKRQSKITSLRDKEVKKYYRIDQETYYSRSHEQRERRGEQTPNEPKKKKNNQRYSIFCVYWSPVAKMREICLYVRMFDYTNCSALRSFMSRVITHSLPPWAWMHFSFACCCC